MKINHPMIRTGYVIYQQFTKQPKDVMLFFLKLKGVKNVIAHCFKDQSSKHSSSEQVYNRLKFPPDLQQPLAKIKRPAPQPPVAAKPDLQQPRTKIKRLAPQPPKKIAVPQKPGLKPSLDHLPFNQQIALRVFAMKLKTAMKNYEHDLANQAHNVKEIMAAHNPLNSSKIWINNGKALIDHITTTRMQTPPPIDPNPKGTHLK